MENVQIMNNATISEFIEHLKTREEQYHNLNKKQERKLIEQYRYSDEEKLRNLLVMHNIRCVFNIAKKQCKKTRDFDEMVARGFYGLIVAAKKFDFDKQDSKKIKNPDGTQTEILLFEKDGSPKYIKFITYATWWVKKYILEEFDSKKNINRVLSHSSSLDSVLRMKNDDTKSTVEEYIYDNMTLDVAEPITQQNELSAKETTALYKNIQDIVMNDNQLSSVEKQIFVETFYKNRTTRDIAKEIGTGMQIVINRKNMVLKRVREILIERFGIKSVNDVISDDTSHRNSNGQFYVDENYSMNTLKRYNITRR